MRLLEFIQHLRSNGRRDFPQPAFKSGLYHYIIQENGERSHIHLRIHNDGSGLLLVNASRAFHLNTTAATMAHLALEKVPDEQAVHTLVRLFRVSVDTVYSDYAQFCRNLQELIRPDGACPVCDLPLEITQPFSSQPPAPYRMDLAITYRCNNDCRHCYNARPRSYPELSTSDWVNILDRLWDIGIPHVVFTGGEPTLRIDLPELVAHATRNGQITGLNTNARRLRDPVYLTSLIDAGLDHVQVTVESHDPEIHDAMVGARGIWKQTIAGLRNALQSPLFVMTNTTMLRDNSPFLEKTLVFLAELGVPTIGLNALIYSGKGKIVGTGLSENELTPLLSLARRVTDEMGQRLIWYTPTQYCHFDPIQLDLGIKGCTAALYNMCVEPDGGVIPCQSYYRQVGNILSDDWETIWRHGLCNQLRERAYLPAKCQGCELIRECGGGCPLMLETQPAELFPVVSI